MEGTGRGSWCPGMMIVLGIRQSVSNGGAFSPLLNVVKVERICECYIPIMCMCDAHVAARIYGQQGVDRPHHNLTRR